MTTRYQSKNQPVHLNPTIEPRVDQSSIKESLPANTNQHNTTFTPRERIALLWNEAQLENPIPSPTQKYLYYLVLILQPIKKTSTTTIPKTNNQLALIEPDYHLDNYISIANAVIHENNGDTLEYRNLIKNPEKSLWEREIAKDLGWLSQGVRTRMKNWTNTNFFLHPSKISKYKNVTYVLLVASIRPL